jgi:hypothetical protein
MPQAKGRSYRPDPNGSPAVLYVSAVGQMGMVVTPTITLGPLRQPTRTVRSIRRFIRQLAPAGAAIAGALDERPAMNHDEPIPDL